MLTQITLRTLQRLFFQGMLLIFLTTLAGCGQTGALYLPTIEEDDD